MSKDHACFVMVSSDIEDEELQSFISQKRKKMKCRKRVVHAIKDNTGTPSIVVSCLASPPDSDDNTSTTSSSSSFTSLQVEQNKRKRHGNLGENKRLKTGNGACDVYPIDKNSQSNLSGTREVHIPSDWRSVKPSHYIFSSDEDSGNESQIRDATNLPKVVTILKGEKNSWLWHKSDGKRTSQKGHHSPKTQGAGSRNGSLSCLTTCKSCSEYSLPNVSMQEDIDMSHYLVLDCEFVGVGPTKKSALGRCSIVNHRGEILFDRFVKPPEVVTDYRTPWSGLRPRNIRCGIPFVAAQEMIRAIIKDKVVIGHAVHNDFRVMGLTHPVHLIRDTASCKLLREMANLPNGVCALRKLTFVLLGRTIQKKEHCSVADARACLDLFRLVRIQWEPILQAKFQRRIVRQSTNKDNATDSVNTSQTDPELSSFLDDEYWPEDMFKD